MALPKSRKKVVPDIGSAVQRAAEGLSGPTPSNKGGRPSPRSGNIVRQTLLLNEDAAERLTLAFAAEQVKRRKRGEKIDKSLFIEEMILDWLNLHGY